jgi:hypothetical protein
MAVPANLPDRDCIMAGIEPGCNPPRVPSSDEFKDPFSEETRDGLLQIRQWSNIQDTENTEVCKWVVIVRLFQPFVIFVAFCKKYFLHRR